MAYTHNDIPLIQKSYDTYKLLHEYTKKFQKTDKYTLGEKMKSTVLDILELLMEAEVAKRDWKETSLQKVNRKLGILKLFIRLAHETKSLDDKKYLLLSERCLELGRMLGGWLKAVQ